jgi:hypothetical protein
MTRIIEIKTCRQCKYCDALFDYCNMVSRAIKVPGIPHFCQLPKKGDLVRGFYRHIKTGKIYEKTGTAINATNAQDGELMVCYSRNGHAFVRDRREFTEKFELADEVE